MLLSKVTEEATGEHKNVKHKFHAIIKYYFYLNIIFNIIKITLKFGFKVDTEVEFFIIFYY